MVYLGAFASTLAPYLKNSSESTHQISFIDGTTINFLSLSTLNGTRWSPAGKRMRALPMRTGKKTGLNYLGLDFTCENPHGVKSPVNVWTCGSTGSHDMLVFGKDNTVIHASNERIRILAKLADSYAKAERATICVGVASGQWEDRAQLSVDKKGIKTVRFQTKIQQHVTLAESRNGSYLIGPLSVADSLPASALSREFVALRIAETSRLPVSIHVSSHGPYTALRASIPMSYGLPKVQLLVRATNGNQKVDVIAGSTTETTTKREVSIYLPMRLRPTSKIFVYMRPIHTARYENVALAPL